MTDPQDPIEAALREPAYLDDGKFTDGVMGALPPRQPRRRVAVLLAAGVAAGLLGAATLGEPLAAALLALGTAGAAGMLLLGAALAAAAGALLRGAR
jgi:peptidoglycan/LPS O-acetylase OafA/YrhL